MYIFTEIREDNISKGGKVKQKWNIQRPRWNSCKLKGAEKKNSIEKKRKTQNLLESRAKSKRKKKRNYREKKGNFEKLLSSKNISNTNTINKNRSTLR